MTFKSIEKYPNSVRSLLPLRWWMPNLSTRQIRHFSCLWGEDPQFSVNPTKSSSVSKVIMRELIMWLNSSVFLDTYWCEYAVQKSCIELEAEGFEPENDFRRINIRPVFSFKSMTAFFCLSLLFYCFYPCFCPGCGFRGNPRIPESWLAAIR